MVGRVINNKEEVMYIVPKDIYLDFQRALASATEVLCFERNEYRYRNNGDGVIIREKDDYVFSMCLHRDMFKLTYEEFVAKCVANKKR